MEVFVEPVDVPALLRQVANRWASAPGIEGRRISLQIEPSAGVIEADAAKLEQILDALIDNALCHAPNGDVEIAARMPRAGAASDVVEISVADRGPGIAEALVPALFETFNSQDDVSASKYGGAGLGLPLCHRLCGLMGASLSVRTAPRVGTTVVVALPRHRREANRAIARPPISPKPPDGTKAMPRILLVEDNEFNRDMLSRRLTRAGYEVLCAEDGPQGVRIAGEARPDLVLMDVALGAMDGWEATQLIHANAALRATPVIAITAHALESDRRRSVEVGCCDFDTKPIDFVRLVGKIERHLSPTPKLVGGFAIDS